MFKTEQFNWLADLIFSFLHPNQASCHKFFLKKKFIFFFFFVFKLNLKFHMSSAQLAFRSSFPSQRRISKNVCDCIAQDILPPLPSPLFPLCF